MPNQYAPLPNPRTDPDAQHEMEAAFGNDSDDDDDFDDSENAESRPLVRQQPSRSHSRSNTLNVTSSGPATYDFENVDYDYPPPPGSPPSTAMPNNWGNSNGLIPSFEEAVGRPRRAGRNWLARVLPANVAQRIGVASGSTSSGAIGGGVDNDGVFANVTAKPSRPRVIVDGDDTYTVPEDSRPEAPPSYAHAQADAVPPYWETTVHAPFSPDSIGEMIIDSMPTGSLFSFLCTMLVSVAFQFIGFLFTYLLHATHAARLGSRAGLGVTLIQYGFALRSQLEDPDEESPLTNNPFFPPDPTITPSPDVPGSNNNATTTIPGVLTDEQANMMLADATTEWLSFFLMTVGWFVLLTSLLGFWRVKRWERGILASQQTVPSSERTTGGSGLSQFHAIFGNVNTTFLRALHRDSDEDHEIDLRRLEDGRSEQGQVIFDGEVEDVETMETERLLSSLPEDDPRREELTRVLENERQLQQDLREAGLL